MKLIKLPKRRREEILLLRGSIERFITEWSIGSISWKWSALWHTTPALFYLALGGSLLSYIHSAPPLKLGIAIVYNFKSVEGDRTMGLQSLLVAFGTEAAKWICVSAIDVTQISVAGLKLTEAKICEKYSQTWSGRCTKTSHCDRQCINWEDARHGACHQDKHGRACFCYFNCKN